MRILVIDDHTLFREAITLLLIEFDPKAIVISATSCDQALGALTHYQDLNLIVLNSAVSSKDCMTFLPKLRTKAPKIPIVVLSATDDSEIICKTLAAGANGFIPKSVGSQEMKSALRLVLDGQVYIPPALLTVPSLLPTAPEKSEIRGEETSLTPRQYEVLDLVASGLPNKLIARELKLTEGTVKLHVSAILRALETRNRTEAVRVASKRGLLSVRDSLH